MTPPTFVDLSQLIAHGAEHASMVSWQHIVPVALAGAAFLLGIGMVSRERLRGAQPLTRSVLAVRWAIIALLLVAAVAHIPVIPEHLEEAPYMGMLFIAFTLAAFGVATGLAASGTRIWYVLSCILCAAAVGAYVATRLIAFPQLADDVGLWAEPLGLVSIATEALAVLLSVVALRYTQSRTHTLQG